jgi:hypothetical protein
LWEQNYGTSRKREKLERKKKKNIKKNGRGKIKRIKCLRGKNEGKKNA